MYRFLSKINGVSAIIAHHSHCIQGHEVNNGVPIFYSIGNSFFPNIRRFEQGNFGMLINMNFSIEEAVELTSYNATRYLNLSNIGKLETGYKSNFLVLDKKFNLIEVYLEGNKIHE